MTRVLNTKGPVSSPLIKKSMLLIQTDFFKYFSLLHLPNNFPFKQEFLSEVEYLTEHQYVNFNIYGHLLRLDRSVRLNPRKCSQSISNKP